MITKTVIATWENKRGHARDFTDATDGKFYKSGEGEFNCESDYQHIETPSELIEMLESGSEDSVKELLKQINGYRQTAARNTARITDRKRRGHIAQSESGQTLSMANRWLNDEISDEEYVTWKKAKQQQLKNA